MLLNQTDSLHMLGYFEINPVEWAVSVHFRQVQSS
jgi:hypothetical protein